MYDQHFYDVIREGARRSVDAALPIILPLLELPDQARILDVGCGEGWWADGFAQAGYFVTGVDSGDTGQRPDTFQFLERNLMETLPTGRWDLVVSLEVAEHLRQRRAVSFVRELCERADMVLFSAARPGQGGTGHVNEQPIGYWAELFEDQGFSVSGALRWHLWGNPDIENWYQQNMLVAMKHACREFQHHFDDGGGTYVLCHPLFDNELLRRPHDVVHPILFDARRPT